MLGKILINTLRVFTNESGEYGNPLGVIVDDGQNIDAITRQRIAAKLNFSETVFINNKYTGEISIYNPQTDVDFAGHALVGTAYLLDKVFGLRVRALQCEAGEVKTWSDGELTWIRSGLENTPPWQFEEVTDNKLVDVLRSEDQSVKQHTVVWAWIDELAGEVRARTFAPDWGIPEDEANGSGAMQLSSQLSRDLIVRHGEGSDIFTEYIDAHEVAIGGRVVNSGVMELGLES